MVLPGGSTKPRCLSAESDQSGLFTSYGTTRSANLVVSVGLMQPVRLSFSSGASTSTGGVQSPGVVGPPVPPAPPLPALPATLDAPPPPLPVPAALEPALLPPIPPPEIPLFPAMPPLPPLPPPTAPTPAEPLAPVLGSFAVPQAATG